ncbi:hypothetical protein F7725_002589 [Dissostichus mawsoni]|uniref:G-protein coupled receptors family 1 profile domain-containing protein n=1 Tax=Dissostichus mawsoni TaxID=36200 RepID=A0A7J5Y2Z7_DISMA|nr:hypothetical protein F7725_002589 [Dissostichus mawsoni]
MVQKLYCVTSRLLNIYGLAALVTTLICPVLFILFTYIRIVIVCYRSSQEVRRKAAQTCLPHLLVLINFTYMKSNSSLNPPYFQFTLFADFGPLRYLFFILCLFIYVTIVSANMVIILAVFLENCLCLNSLCGSAGFFPRFLQDILSDSHLVSRPLCFIQMYVIYTYASCELTILTIMAYDRFIAICQPLHYHSKMTFQKVQFLVLVAVFYPVFTVGFLLYLTVKLPLCGNKLFCSNWPVVQLSCVDTTPNNVAGQFVTTAVGIVFFANSKLCSFTFRGIFCNNSIYNLQCVSSSALSVYGVFMLTSRIRRYVYRTKNGDEDDGHRDKLTSYVVQSGVHTGELHHRPKPP